MKVTVMMLVPLLMTLLVLLYMPFTSKNGMVLAYPYGSGTCAAGESIKMGHGGAGGKLSDSGLKLYWGATELNPSQPTTIGKSIDHTLTVTGAHFKGFLFRLSGKSGQDVSHALVSQDSFAQVSTLCSSKVAGITHRSSSYKQQVTVTLNYPNHGNLLLEVTIVTVSETRWVYDAFEFIVAGNSTPSSTFAPTSVDQHANIFSGSSSSWLTSRYYIGNIIIAGIVFLFSWA